MQQNNLPDSQNEVFLIDDPVIPQNSPVPATQPRPQQHVYRSSKAGPGVRYVLPQTVT